MANQRQLGDVKIIIIKMISLYKMTNNVEVQT